jgi:NAD(P)-dependent dehydrogenase (short-subunit alcohol dehydrogenase family)
VTAPLADGFSGRVSVVTGGASGIGKALATALAEAGSKVVIADVEQTKLDATAAELREATRADVTGVVTDVTKVESVHALADAVYDRHGACHLLVNNAGVSGPSGKIWDSTPNDWTWITSVNVFGVAYGIQAFVPRMLAGGEPGHIVNTSSGNGSVMPLAAAAVYAASKASVTAITECLALQLELDEAKIGASLFLPSGGLLDTGLWTADRNRPEGLARERPRDRPGITVQQLVDMAAKAGKTLPIQPLDELAQVVLDGIKAGTYTITIGLDGDAETLAERARRFGKGLNPAYIVDTGFGI